MIGKTLLHYEVERRLGEGGMGEVFLARDTKLDREVAIKVIAEGLARDPDRVLRFRREAKMLASLNHPNIAAIYGLEETEGRSFLVMEYVAGPTLAELGAERKLLMNEVLQLAGQIADGLEEAHGKNIVHRDLKPANIKVAPNDQAKILDFGLAKLVAEPEADPSDRTMSGVFATQYGTVMGTPSYMSPEQARGESVDARSDLWALGCVLYEMFTGKPAFPGKSYAEIVASVLSKEPNWDALPGGIPRGVLLLLMSCFAKDPDARVSRARDVGDEIRRALAWKEQPPVEGAPLQPRLTQLTYSEGMEEAPTWAPSGDEIVFSRQVGTVRKLFRLRIAGGEAFPITRGDHDDLQPMWHPAEDRLLFVRARTPGRKFQPGDIFAQYGSADEEGDVWELDLASGAERLLVERAYNPAYSPDGARIAADASRAGPRRIWVFDARGRNAQQVTTESSEAVSHVRPRWSPDGGKLVFQSVERTQFDIRSVNLATNEMHWLTRDLVMDFHPVWSPSGTHVYFTSYRSGGMNLWRVPVDETGEPRGALRQVTTGAGQDVEASVSPDSKRLAFCILRQNADIWRLPIVAASGHVNGDPEAVVSSTREDSRGAWSPDESAIAFNSDRTGEMNLWLFRFGDRSLARLTEGPGGDYQPNWSPDMKSLVFFSSRNCNPGIWKLDLETREIVCLSPKDKVEVNPFYSPDGKLIAYQSDRDGRLEVWVMNADGSESRQLTRVGVTGHFLRWSRNGEWIYFRSQSGGSLVHRVRVDGGEPEPLPSVRGGSHISLSPDESHVMDVMAHNVLWCSGVEGGEPEEVFHFPDPDVRIDYPVWSPGGEWLLFDRFSPRGGDIWMMENFE